MSARSGYCFNTLANACLSATRTSVNLIRLSMHDTVRIFPETCQRGHELRPCRHPIINKHFYKSGKPEVKRKPRCLACNSYNNVLPVPGGAALRSLKFLRRWLLNASGFKGYSTISYPAALRQRIFVCTNIHEMCLHFSSFKIFWCKTNQFILSPRPTAMPFLHNDIQAWVQRTSSVTIHEQNSYKVLSAFEYNP